MTICEHSVQYKMHWSYCVLRKLYVTFLRTSVDVMVWDAGGCDSNSETGHF